MMRERIARAQEYCEAYGVDALVFLGMSNIRYLSGFTGSDGAVVITRSEGFFLTDSRYVTQAGFEVSELATSQYQGKLEGITGLLKEIKAERVALEAEHTTVSQWQALAKEMPGTELVPLGAELDRLRIFKDQDELVALGRAAEIASTALLDTLAIIRPGAVERDVALALEFAMKKSGAENISFDFIVASGPRGALPHGKASTKTIQAGELVTVDFGAVYQGYHSDETVTVAVGRPDARQQEIYEIVKDAHDLALAAIRPGVSLKELDAIARGHIGSSGYGDYFGHGLGHGVGLDVHEKPVVSPRTDGIVDEGMVFTIEPGIYLPDWGGVRIEDTVVVTADGFRQLTKVDKNLIVV